MSKPDFIINFVRKVLKEQAEEKNKESKESPKPKKSKMKKHAPGDIVVGYGGGKGSGGRFLGSVNEAGALAKKDPKALMKNLGVGSGGTGLAGAEKLVSAVISGTDAMSRALKGVSKVKSGGKDAVFITPGEINARNVANLLHHVFIGAKGAGIFASPKEALQIQVSGGKVVIYQSPFKNSWKE